MNLSELMYVSFGLDVQSFSANVSRPPHLWGEEGESNHIGALLGPYEFTDAVML